MGASATDAAFFCFVIRCSSEISQGGILPPARITAVLQGILKLVVHSHIFSVVFLLTALVAYAVCTRTDFYQHYLGEKPQDLETKQVTQPFTVIVEFGFIFLSV